MITKNTVPRSAASAQSRWCRGSQRMTAFAVAVVLLSLLSLVNVFKSCENHVEVEEKSVEKPVDMPTETPIDKAIRPPRLPPDYRWAGETCVDDESLNFAEATMEPMLSLDHQRGFANGIYLKIAKGSNNLLKVGPIINFLSSLQHKKGVFGSLGEIGVHHGRFTGFLFVTARKSEQLVVGDVFELQEKNVDYSGHGSRDKFMEGIQLYGLNESDLHTVFTGSTDELPFDWSKQAGFHPFRFFSVDAGHTAGLTFNDLELAFCNLVKGGIVAMDDWFHQHWPGVTEGVHQFASLGPLEHVYPFLLCEDKVFATNDIDAYNHYYRSILNDPELKKLVSPWAMRVHYRMMGKDYLRCHAWNPEETERIRELWTKRLY